MADIAMLVAEEYERRVKNSRKGRGEEEDIELLSCVGFLGKNFRGPLSSFWIKQKKMIFMEEKKLGFEPPKSHVTLAATNGFFSA
ncbi:hypothetical protein OROGR_019033 [Orobanche gracilis]